MRRSSIALTLIIAVVMLGACRSEAGAPAQERGAALARTPVAPGAAPAVAGNLTIWHAYGTGSAEEQALNELLEQARQAYPQATISVLQIPFDQIFAKFQNEVVAGGGPDLFVAPNDWLGDQVRAGLLKPLDGYRPLLKAIAPSALDGMSVDGTLYAIPESFKAVALYYNKERVAQPPATTDELLAAVRAGKTLVLHQTPYHSFGWLGAFEGRLLDQQGRCVADQRGGQEWFSFLKELKAERTVTFSIDDGQVNALFKEGKADMVVNGPWVLGDYKAVLGDQLGVATMPGARQPAGPLTGVDGFYVNVNSPNVEGAVGLALFLTQPEALELYVRQAGHVPVNPQVSIDDPLVQGFAQAAQTGVARPQDASFANYWGPFGAAITKVLDGNADPQQAIAEACALMNKANQK